MAGKYQKDIQLNLLSKGVYTHTNSRLPCPKLAAIENNNII